MRAMHLPVKIRNWTGYDGRRRGGPLRGQVLSGEIGAVLDLHAVERRRGHLHDGINVPGSPVQRLADTGN